MLVALIIFAVTYILLLALPRWRAWIALASGALFIALGILPVGDVASAIDWNVLMMIAGTMGIVSLFIDSGMPALMADVLEGFLQYRPAGVTQLMRLRNALVRPLLAALQRETLPRRTFSARLTCAVPSNHGREELVAVRLTGEEAEPVANKSGLITTLAHADGYFSVPRDAEGLPQDARVDVVLF